MLQNKKYATKYIKIGTGVCHLYRNFHFTMLRMLHMIYVVDLINVIGDKLSQIKSCLGFIELQLASHLF